MEDTKVLMKTEVMNVKLEGFTRTQASNRCKFMLPYDTLMAVICSGVGAMTFGACSSFGISGDLACSVTVNVFTDCLLTSSTASVEANNSSASVLSYQQRTSLQITARKPMDCLNDSDISQKLENQCLMK